MGESLPGLARRLGVPAPSVLSALFSRWEDIVGPLIAAEAWPIRVKDGVLRIGVTQPGWATQLAFLGPDLVRKVTAAIGDTSVSGIEVKVLSQRPETTA